MITFARLLFLPALPETWINCCEIFSIAFISGLNKPPSALRITHSVTLGKSCPLDSICVPTNIASLLVLAFS